MHRIANYSSVYVKLSFRVYLYMALIALNTIHYLGDEWVSIRVTDWLDIF